MGDSQCGLLKVMKFKSINLELTEIGELNGTPMDENSIHDIHVLGAGFNWLSSRNQFSMLCVVCILEHFGHYN